MKSNFSIIESKLDDFIKKFYSNRIVVGLILFALIFVVSLFVVFMLESFTFMIPIVKTILFYFLIFLFAAVFVFFVAIPVGKILKILPFISYEEAANIISNYFKDTDDLLINILQLNQHNNNDFLVAAINQKIDKISPLNFTNAIDVKRTFRFLGFSLAVLFTILTLIFVFKSNFFAGATRFMNYNTYYQPENPYTLNLENDSLYCAYGDDLTLLVSINGPSLPKDVYLKNDLLNIRLNKDTSNCYSYTLKNITQDLEFSFEYLGFNSEKYNVVVYKKPQLSNLKINITPPSYTEIQPTEIDNSGDFTVPFGSKITWNFDVEDINNFEFNIDSNKVNTTIDNNIIHINHTSLKSFEYNYIMTGELNSVVKSDLFHVKTIPDYYPQIQVTSMPDTSTSNSVFFYGHISDDYGFKSLSFKYYDTGNPKNVKTENIEIVKSSSQDFYFYYDFSKLSNSTSYYFEVKDNDAVSGFKATKSPIAIYSTISDEEKESRISNLNSSIFDKVEQSKRLLRELNNDLNDFQKSVSSNNNISEWEKQLKLNNLVEKQNQLQDLINQLSKDNQSKNAFENQLSQEQSQELLNQQQELQKLWDQLLSDDIKDLLDKINELAKSMNEKNFRDNIQDLKFDFKQLSEQLDRNTELMKMYNIDNQLQNLSKSIDEMSKEYKELSDEVKNPNDNSNVKSDKDLQNISNKNDSRETSNENANDIDKQNNLDNNKKSKVNQENLSEKMKDFINKFKDKYDEYKQLQKQNDELGRNKLQLNDVDKQFNDLLNQMQFQKDEIKDLEQKTDSNSNDNKNVNSDNKSENYNQNNESYNNQDLNNNNNSDNKEGLDKNNSQQNGSDNSSSENQRKKRQNISLQMDETSEDIDELADNMQGLNNKSKEKRNKENLNDIRQILDNLLTVSFKQEFLIDKLKKNSGSVYLTTDMYREQNSLMKDFELVRDSIYSVANRNNKIEHIVYEKLKTINSYFTKINSSINDNKRSQTMTNQQVLLTNINDLSLLFSEIIDSMQNQDNQQGQQGQEEQENTSKNKKEMQQRQQNTQRMQNQQLMLKQQLQQLMQKLEKGDKLTSKQLAESLKMQEMMMQQLQQMQNSKGLSTDEQKLMNQIQKMMEDNKRDIINNNVSRNLINRQDMLYNKLLDLEKAEKTQDDDEKRESKQGTEFQIDNTQNLNLKLKDFGIKEFMNCSPIDLNLFYQDKYNEYINSIK